MYCKMLQEAVLTAQGKEVEVDFDTKVDLSVDAFIPAEYILNEVQKLDIYKRIAGVETMLEKEDMIQELEDRFGHVPVAVDNLIRINLLRVHAHSLYMTDIRNVKEKIQFVFRPDAKINPENIPAFVKHFRESMNFTPIGMPTFTYRCVLSGMVEKDAQTLLKTCEMVLEQMEQILCN